MTYQHEFVMKRNAEYKKHLEFTVCAVVQPYYWVLAYKFRLLKSCNWQHPWQRHVRAPTRKLTKIQENKYIYSEIVCSFVFLFHLTAQHSPTSHLPPPLPMDTQPSSPSHNCNITCSTMAATT